MGFSRTLAFFPWLPDDARVAWWAGNGGSLSFVDLDERMAIGFTPNRWIGGPHEQDRSRSLVHAAYASLRPEATT
jgi:hypothetical protein